jgi:hypothetical protein
MQGESIAGMSTSRRAAGNKLLTQSPSKNFLFKIFSHNIDFIAHLATNIFGLYGCRFVEVMVPVFSRDAWRCVWHMMQVRTLVSIFVITGLTFFTCLNEEWFGCRMTWSMHGFLTPISGDVSM